MDDKVTWQDNSTVAQYMWDDLAEQGNAGSPGAGRVRLRPNRGFPGYLAGDVIPQESIVRADCGFRSGSDRMGGKVTWQDDSIVAQ